MPSNKSATKPKSSPAEPVWHWSFSAIGTKWWIGVYDAVPNAESLQQAVLTRIAEFDVAYSRFRADSLVSAMATQAGTYTLPDDAAPLLRFYKQLYDVTDGALTPLVGRLLSDAGYDAEYSLRAKEHLPKTPAWRDVLDVSENTVTLKQSALLDFGAAGKGYLVDVIAALLQANGVTAFCIDAGGDMFCSGVSEPLKIGLENPDNIEEAIGVARLHNQALCGSAPNRRSWGNYHHIMDPRTKQSTTHVKAAWVSAQSALLADGLTTALFFVSPEKLKTQFPFEYALVYADGSLRYSPQFPGEFFD
jgi:FAD:protein FMN transferase